MQHNLRKRSIRLSITAALITFLIISLGQYGKPITFAVQKPLSASNDKYGFRSSTELLGTFYYGWYKGQNHQYEGWDTDNHNPPITWASNYLPDIGRRQNAFDPTHNLYESQDQYILTKQLGWMKQAGIQFGISIWEGKGSASDNTFSYIINNVMPSTNNPYPSFRWTLHYELEGYSDPPVKNLTNDLNYIKERYASSPYYLKIDGKPVIFVFNSANDLGRWSTVRQLTGFYVVMKVDPLYEGANPNSMDGWYEYNPIKRFEQQKGFSAFVSPGFWQYHQSPKLARNISDFEIAVRQLASADVHFKLIETWNEWFEGTQVEPAMQIVHDDVHGFRPQSASYGNIYINILGKYFAGR